MELFGVGIGEAGLVFIIMLLVVGPERFPQVARQSAKYYRMARRFTAEVTGDLRVALNELENEVNEQTGDLKSVREISEDVRAGVHESASDISSIGEGATAAAGTATQPWNDAPDAPAHSPSAAPEAPREPEPDAPPPGTAGAAAAAADPFALVRAAYADYHTPPATPSSTPAAPPPTSEATPDVDANELSRQAAEAFEEFRKPVEPSTPATAYSPQQIVGVNPFAGGDPPTPLPARKDTDGEAADDRRPASTPASEDESVPSVTTPGA